MSTLRRVLSLLVPLAVFVLILMGVNTYQYLKIKNDIAANIIKVVNDAELKELQSFFQSIESKLNLVRDWGKNGVLYQKNVQDLNRKFIPLIANEPRFSGLILADNNGSEYFLNRQEKSQSYLTRMTRQEQGQATQHYQQWADAETKEQAWQEQASYNPTSRPWFQPETSLDSITWTRIYTFYHSKQQGFTASVAWQTQDKGFAVFAIDILLTGIEQLLIDSVQDSPAALFLVNARNNTFVTGKTGNHPEQAERSSALPLLLPEGISRWVDDGRPVREIVAVQHQGEKWLMSLQPLSKHEDSFWVGVAAPEPALLSTLNKRFFSVDMLDVGVALAAGLILFSIMWKTGSLRSHRPIPAPIVRLSQYINQGEGPGIEFKSSVRMNLKTGKPGKEIELAWLKAVVAFLNTSGGVLLIGVNDDGKIVGLTADDFENSDRCLLHLKNLIHQHVGAEFASFIRTTLVTSEDNQTAMLECQSATEPVFLRIGKNEEFYIRSGPSSTKLTPSQMISYVLQNRR